MITTSIAQPDITIVLDQAGIIREARLSREVASGSVDEWIGRAWTETVADVGADKVRRMMEDAQRNGASAFRQINQRFPSGIEIPIEYTAVSLGEKKRLDCRRKKP